VDEAARVVVQAEHEPVYLVNPADRAALEAALRLVALDTRVTALTLGPPQDEDALRYCLARGAHAAARVWDEALADLDPFLTALTLSKAIALLAPDLVICGTSSAAGGNAQVPATLAELLGLPQLTGVVTLELGAGGRSLRAQRRLERGNRVLLECPLPALVAVEEGSFAGRYVSWRAQLRARQPIRRLGLADLGLTPDEVGLDRRLTRMVALSPPQPRTKRTLAPAASGHGLLATLMGGGAAAKRSSSTGPLKGPPDEVAAQLAKFLQEKGFLRTERPAGERAGTPARSA
jgi:electron transfer flavoprotein beta subunit